MTDFPESDDLRRAQRGEADAFERLVERYARRVHDLARRMLRDPQEAEDVSQQAFLNAWRALGRFDPERPFRNWLLRITSNLCRNRLAARKRAKVLPPRGGEEAAIGIQAPPPLQRGGGAAPSPVQQAIEALPERYRLPVILHYVHGLTLDAISEITEVPVATVKTHLFRGRAALRGLLLPPRPPETPPPGGGTGD